MRKRRTPAGVRRARPAADGARRQAARDLHGRLLQVARLAALAEMAAGVAHELNQPLTAITNYAHACERLLARAGSDPAQLREALHAITVETGRAADVIRRVREQADRPRADRERASVNTVVAELREFVQSQARLQGARLRLALAPDLPEIAVDADRIQQAVLNFVSNSLEALARERTADGSICIQTSLTDEDAVELAVIDNGPGLSADAMQRAFDPFFSTKADGMGLGLSINRSIARAHGGSVGYRPNRPAGACFYMRLPTPPED